MYCLLRYYQCGGNALHLAMTPFGCHMKIRTFTYFDITSSRLGLKYMSICI